MGTAIVDNRVDIACTPYSWQPQSIGTISRRSSASASPLSSSSKAPLIEYLFIRSSSASAAADHLLPPFRGSIHSSPECPRIQTSPVVCLLHTIAFISPIDHTLERVFSTDWNLNRHRVARNARAFACKPEKSAPVRSILFTNAIRGTPYFVA